MTANKKTFYYLVTYGKKAITVKSKASQDKVLSAYTDLLKEYEDVKVTTLNL